jgi:hypothetical protein
LVSGSVAELLERTLLGRHVARHVPTGSQHNMRSLATMLDAVQGYGRAQ